MAFHSQQLVFRLFKSTASSHNTVITMLFADD